MPVRPWRRELCRYWKRTSVRRLYRRTEKKNRRVPAALVTLLVAVALAFGVIRGLEARLRPVLEEMARTQVVNQMTGVVEHAAQEALSQQQVEDGALVSIERNSDGAITALTTDMSSLNSMRTQIVTEVLRALEEVDVSNVQIPLGSLLDSELIWARGPAIRARAMTVGTISAEFESDFTAAGVNQTLHRIWLELSVPLTVMLPGGEVQAELNSRLCVAETVIVGSVPSTYLQMESSLP